MFGRLSLRKHGWVALAERAPKRVATNKKLSRERSQWCRERLCTQHVFELPLAPLAAEYLDEGIAFFALAQPVPPDGGNAEVIFERSLSPKP